MKAPGTLGKTSGTCLSASWGLVSITMRVRISSKIRVKYSSRKRKYLSTPTQTGLRMDPKLASQSRVQVSYNASLTLSTGPGHYNHSSNFDLNTYVKSLDDKGTYLANENGHINRKKQMYHCNNNSKGRKVEENLPGPAHYHPNLQFGSKHVIKRNSNRKLNASVSNVSSSLVASSFLSTAATQRIP